uniref:Globin domain-containing protein n=1 Tax=Strigamia maritima TaxID=126957 RepID=T1JFM7_STRMM
MTTLDESIQALENVDAFTAYLHQVGRSHTRVPGYKKEYFWRIQKPFLEAVSETLGDRYTENMETIYTVTIQFILETLVKGFEIGEKEKGV